MEAEAISPQADEHAEAQATARRLAALAHPTRLAILRQLAASEACCVKDVVSRVGLAQSTVSQHLRILVDAGLVRYRTNRQSSCYSIDRAALGALADEIVALIGACCGSACCSKKD